MFIIPFDLYEYHREYDGGNEAKDQMIEEVTKDYEKWEKKNNDSITKIIVNTFPKYFLFYAF